MARFFEGYFFLPRPQAWLVSSFVAVISLLFALHALLALRKFPADWRQYRIAATHGSRLRHGDTVLWFVQVATGFAMFFLAPVHLYAMFMHPDLIGPYASADRVWTGGFWPLYLALLFAVEVHGSVGLYRLAVKWGWFEGGDARASRRRLKIAMWGLIAFLLTSLFFGLLHLSNANATLVSTAYLALVGVFLGLVFGDLLAGGVTWLLMGLFGHEITQGYMVQFG